MTALRLTAHFVKAAIQAVAVTALLIVGCVAYGVASLVG